MTSSLYVSQYLVLLVVRVITRGSVSDLYETGV